jgi:hypothetical protein
MSRKTLAFGITYYDEGPLLTRAIESLLQGSSLPDEILVYDDASSNPATEFIPQNAPVQVIKNQSNRGVSFGRNLLMSESVCDYIHFHDADDPVHPQWCARLLSVIHKLEPDIIVTGLRVQREGCYVRSGFLDAQKRFPPSDDLTLESIRWGMATQEVTFKRLLGLQVGGFQTREILEMVEDSEFYTRLAFAASSCVRIDEPIAIRELRTNSYSLDNSGTPRIEYIANRYQMAKLLREALSERYHDELAEMVIGWARVAADQGLNQLADQGIKLAFAIGQPAYRYQATHFKIIARVLGPSIACRMGASYKSCLPIRLRRAVSYHLRPRFNNRDRTVEWFCSRRENK